MWGGFNSFRDPTRNTVLTSRFMEEDLKRTAGKKNFKEGTNNCICCDDFADRNYLCYFVNVQAWLTK